MTKILSNNRRIVRNTLMLYFRMFLTLSISLYTGRVVLNVLGIEDYGIFNVVGGVIVMTSFFNSSFASATQRFFSYELGQQNPDKLKKVFSVALSAHVVIAIIIFIIGETLGLWFLKTQLVIPSDKMSSAIWIYQCSVIIFLLSVCLTPFNAAIISHEKMSFYACISIVDVTLKLAVVYLLTVVSFNKLELYGILLTIVFVLNFFINMIYSMKHFKECRLGFVFDKQMIKEMFGFSGWMFWGSITNILSTHGVNMLINIFYGPLLNAARGIAFQINGAVNSFSNNLMVAVNPQIVKSYAVDNTKYTFELVFRTSKLSFFLLLFIILPVLAQTEYILRLWLKGIPDYSVIFTRLVLIDLLVSSLFLPISTLIQSTGKIKFYQMFISILFLLIFGLTYIVFKMNLPVYSTFILSIFISTIGLIGRLIIVSKQTGISLHNYYKNVIVKIFLVALISFTGAFIVHFFSKENLASLILLTISIWAIMTPAVYWLGFDEKERSLTVSLLRSLKNRDTFF